jgi:hypothetical protein
MMTSWNLVRAASKAAGKQSAAGVKPEGQGASDGMVRVLGRDQCEGCTSMAGCFGYVFPSVLIGSWQLRWMPGGCVPHQKCLEDCVDCERQTQ